MKNCLLLVICLIVLGVLVNTIIPDAVQDEPNPVLLDTSRSTPQQEQQTSEVVVEKPDNYILTWEYSGHSEEAQGWFAREDAWAIFGNDGEGGGVDWDDTVAFSERSRKNRKIINGVQTYTTWVLIPDGTQVEVVAENSDKSITQAIVLTGEHEGKVLNFCSKDVR